MIRALPFRSSIPGALLALLTVLVVPPTVRADLGHPAVHRARRALARYDLEGDRSTTVIHRLGRLAVRLDAPSDQREARFLRSMAAADLLILAHHTDRPALRARVAKAYGAPEGELESQLIRALEALSVGVYRDAARDALAALRVLRALGADRPVDWASVSGPRSDVLYADQVRRTLESGVPAVPRLATMAPDPCANGNGDAGECSEALRFYDAQGRRAVAALASAQRALSRLSEAARSGDPFPRALGSALRQGREALSSALLAPAPRIPDDVRISAVPAGARPVSADLLVVVEPGRVRYGWVPRVRVGPGGAVERVSPAEEGAVLPRMDEAAIPRDFRPAVQAIEGLTERFVALGGPGEATAALASDPDVHAHVPSRVLRSLREAGIRPVMLAGRAPDGSVRGVAIRLRDAREGPEGNPAVEVRVRMGGYTVRTGGGSTEVSRIRDEQGLRFDVEGLVRAAGEGPPANAAVDFMTVAEMGPVTLAAFALAPQEGPLQLLVP